MTTHGPSGRARAASSSTRSNIRPLLKSTWLTRIRSWSPALAAVEEALGEICRTARRRPFVSCDAPDFRPARELPPGRMEFAVAGQDAQRRRLRAAQPRPGG